MNPEQKKVLRDRLLNVEREVSYYGRDRRGMRRREPAHIRKLRARAAKLDKQIRRLVRIEERKRGVTLRPVYRAIETARTEILFGETQKALALVKKVEALAKKVLR